MGGGADPRPSLESSEYRNRACPCWVWNQDASVVKPANWSLDQLCHPGSIYAYIHTYLHMQCKEICFDTAVWQLVASTSPCRTEFNPRTACVGYAVKKVRMRQVFLPVYLSVSFHLYSLLKSITDFSKQMLEWYFTTARVIFPVHSAN